MLTDTEIIHLQRSIAFHRSKQVEVIASRDAVISNLQFDVKNMNSVILKHRDEYAIIKEKLVKVMTEFEMRGILLDAEKQKYSVTLAAVDLKENSLVIARQEIEFLRKQLAESEGLVTLGSQQRNKVQELETSLLHSREQIRLISDNKSTSESQLHSLGRELEDIKFKCASAEMKIELTLKEKSFLCEEISELKQQLAKSRALSAEELSEVKRELLKTKDSVESERILRTKLESIGESARAKDMEEYRCRAEIQQREIDARSPVPSLEREKDKLSSQIDALREALEAKEAERSSECEKSRALDSQIAKLLLDLETSKGQVEEARVRYNAVRAEGRYARQKVLESVGFVIDILSVAGVGETDPPRAQNPLQLQDRTAEGTYNPEASLTNSMGIMRKAQKSILMLSPRAKDSIRAQLGPVQVPGQGQGLGVDTSTGGNIMNPLRLFSDDTIEGGGSQGGLSIGQSLGGAGHDPFDLPILHGLTDALCLPDLRSVLQTLRDHLERVLSAQAAHQSNIDTEMRQRIERVERDKNVALVSELEAAEKTIAALQRDLDTQRRRADDLTITIGQMERNMDLERQRKMDMELELERSQRLRLTETFAPQTDVRVSQTVRERDRDRDKDDFQMGGSSMRKEKEWDSVLFEDDMRLSLAFNHRDNQGEKVQEKDLFRARNEYKNAIMEMSRRHEAEKGMLTEEVGMLKERVSTLISQNKDCNSYLSLVVPVPSIPEGDEDIADRGRDRGRVDCSAESDEENRMILNPLALALTSERANSASLSARLDVAKESISFLTTQVSAAAGLGEELDRANETIASLTSQVLQVTITIAAMLLCAVVTSTASDIVSSGLVSMENKECSGEHNMFSHTLSIPSYPECMRSVCSSPSASTALVP